MKAHIPMVIGFAKTALIDVRTAVAALTSWSTSIGKDATVAMMKPAPQPKKMSAQPARRPCSTDLR